MKRLRTFILSVVCLTSISAYAAPTASEQVRQHLSDGLRGQIIQWLATLSKASPADAALTPERLGQQTDALLQQALVRYNPVFTLSEQPAQALLTKGPNDTDNLAALKRNWEVYKKVVLPLPTLMKRLHEQVQAGAISGGWDLELACRVSDAHLTECTDAQRHYEESQKKHP